MASLQAGDIMESYGSKVLFVLAFPFVILTITFTSRVIYNLYFHPLRAYPGPKTWAASNIPYCLHLRNGTIINSKLLELHQTYGKVVRIMPNELSWVDDAVWRDVWAHRQGHQEFVKDPRFSMPAPSGAWGILFAPKADHSRYRKLLSHAFSDKGMREQQPVIQGYVDLLIAGLRKKAPEDSQDMVQWFNWTTFDVIGRLSFGEDFGCPENIRTHPWIAIVFGNIRVTILVTFLRRLGLAGLLPYLASSKTTAARQYNHQYSVDKIDARLKRGTDVGDFWDNVLQHSVDGDKSGMTRLEMEANASHLVLAGSETTATLLSGTLYQLLKNPSAMQKVVAEIRGAFTSIDEIDLYSTAQLKYTLAVLEETMRIYPPVPSAPHRVVPSGGDTVHNHYLPAGTCVHLPQYVAYHLESNFTKPFEFHPERFLPDTKEYEDFRNDNFAVIQPFSVGSRNCIGKNLAYAEMRLILAKFFFVFDVELDVGKTDVGGKAWTDQRTFTLWEKRPLMAKLKAVN